MNKLEILVEKTQSSIESVLKNTKYECNEIEIEVIKHDGRIKILLNKK